MKTTPIQIEITEPEAAVAMSMSKQSEPQARSLGKKIVNAYVVGQPTLKAAARVQAKAGAAKAKGK